MKLCFREVTKSYGSNLALDHFTASLEPLSLIHISEPTRP